MANEWGDLGNRKNQEEESALVSLLWSKDFSGMARPQGEGGYTSKRAAER